MERRPSTPREIYDFHQALKEEGHPAYTKATAQYFGLDRRRVRQITETHRLYLERRKNPAATADAARADAATADAARLRRQIAAFRAELEALGAQLDRIITAMG